MTEAENIIRCGHLSLNNSLKIVEYKGQRINLTPTSFELLNHLMTLSPAVVSVDELLEHVWQQKVVNRETVKQQIKSLRHQLVEAGRMVQSVRGFGYQVIADEVAQVASDPSSNKPKRSGLIMLFLVMVAAIIALTWYRMPPQRMDIQLPLKTATMPFKLLDSEDQDLVLLLQDELTNMLSKQQDVKAIAVSAIEHANEQKYSTQEYAAYLGVDVLFEGLIQEHETGYHVSIRMIWAQNSVAAWRDNIEISGKDRQSLVDQTRDAIKAFIDKKIAYIKRLNKQ